MTKEYNYYDNSHFIQMSRLFFLFLSGGRTPVAQVESNFLVSLILFD